jgi:gliding motility-associated-like protein
MEWEVIDSNGKLVTTSNLNTPEFLIRAPGLYTVNLTTSDSFLPGLIATSQQTFEIYDSPIASFQARPTTVFVPDTEMNTFNFSTGANTYNWDFGDGTTSDEREPKHIYKIEGVYDVVLVAGFDHDNGIVCTDTLVQKISAKQGGQTKIPNAFTPNPGGPSGGLNGGGSGSGGAGSFNDVFLPIVKGVEEFNMQIFDRWGNLIFESNSSNQGWDGYDRNGNILPSGVYIYKLTLRLSDGQRTTQLGDITMIR